MQSTSDYIKTKFQIADLFEKISKHLLYLLSVHDDLWRLNTNFTHFEYIWVYINNWITWIKLSNLYEVFDRKKSNQIISGEWGTIKSLIKFHPVVGLRIKEKNYWEKPVQLFTQTNKLKWQPKFASKPQKSTWPLSKYLSFSLQSLSGLLLFSPY